MCSQISQENFVKFAQYSTSLDDKPFEFVLEERSIDLVGFVASHDGLKLVTERAPFRTFNGGLDDNHWSGWEIVAGKRSVLVENSNFKPRQWAAQ